MSYFVLEWLCLTDYWCMVCNKFNVHDLCLPCYYRIFCACVIVSIVTVWLFLNSCFVLKCVFSGRRLQMQWVEDTSTTCKISSWCGTAISKFYRSMSQLHTCIRYKMLHLLSAWAQSYVLWHDLSLSSHSSLTDWT